MVLSLAVAAVVVLLLGVGMFVLGNEGGTSGAQDERGAERFLQMTPGGPAVRYGDAAAYDACAVLPPDALEQTGLEISPNRNLEHSYTKEDVAPDQAFTGNEMSGCDYLVQSATRGADNVSLKLYQQPRSPRSELEWIAGRAADADVPAEIRTDRGVQVGYWRDSDQEGGWLMTAVRPEAAVHAVITLTDPEYGGRPAEQVVRDLSTRLVDGLAAGPSALEIAYTGPYADTPHPCDLLNPAALEASFPGEASGWVRDTYLPGELSMAGTGGYRVDTGCSRSIAAEKDIYGPSPDGIRASFMHWDAPEAGREHLATICGRATFGKEPVPSDVRIGDGETCLTDLIGDWRLEFQAGKTTVTLSPTHAPQDPQQVARLLEPAAQEIIRNLP
ncbi:hypothetical protein ACL03H_05285 [Saccharopolyspora sp. MS10]|uniref:hypothetical protein n=1 Tax=Saccharopolyspora sp. MS10 TaxID=3385973 RepID=UPI0039A3D7B2